MAKMIHIEVAHARPERQVLLSVTLPEGSTAEQAIAASKIHEHFDALDVRDDNIGVFGHLVKLDEVLQDGDRVEIYRPLIADPKVVRRERAELEKLRRQRAKD